MKFNFSLQKVLEHRKTLEDIAQRDFQQALVNYQTEVNNLEQLKSQRQLAFHKGYKIPTKDAKNIPPKLQQTQEFILGQDKRIEIQKAKVQHLAEEVEKMREILRERAISFKIIEKLKEKKFRDFIQEQKIKDQKELDEVNVIRHPREDKR